MLRWICVACLGFVLTGCISVTNPPSQTFSNPSAQDSSREIAELRKEIRSLRDSMAEGQRDVPSPSQSAGGDIDYTFVEELLRKTSTVAAMPKVVFTKPKEFSEYSILEYGVYEGVDAGANGIAFIERGYGSRFNEFREIYTTSCREEGSEFFEIRQSANSDDTYGTMSYVYACLTRSKDVQLIGKSETLFVLDGGHGIGYTEVISYPLSYRDALQIVREKQRSF